MSITPNASAPFETRALNRDLYPALAGQLDRNGLNGAEICHLQSATGDEIHFPAALAPAVDAALTDLGGLANTALEDAKRNAYSRFIGFVDGFTRQVLKQYPAAETMAWSTKQAEARAILGGGDVADTLILKELAVALNLDAAGVTVLANSVLEKTSKFTKISAAIEGLRNLAEIKIAALTSVDDAGPLVETLMDTVNAKAVELGFGDAVTAG